MKKVVIFLVIIIGLFVAIAIVTKVQQEKKSEGNVYQKESLHPTTVELLDDPLYQNIILPDELEKKLKNKEDVTVYFFSPTCSHCIKTTPVVTPLAKEKNIDLVQYNLKEFENGFKKYGITHTPTLMHFKDGKEAARMVGSHPKEDFAAWFDEHVKK
ncbi:thiol-disulfide isomerase/thioredoxin [Bacillus thermophilus]|uniref:Thiol-disulfide isomerase/thioredoxin n=1 Tax=Siminovitchia thermophila TaxID=1245522 RepID=A0ABS2R632_9BACI|nr:thioredoxin family protein [Siminovitchia thermophila]MBM7715121.1 thiol-disulfide isomerase/thioredoxin [Siminovitchia thermophila]